MTTIPFPANPRFIDLTGQTFGRLTVVKYLGKRGNGKWHWWQVRCECGKLLALHCRSTIEKRGRERQCRHRTVHKVRWRRLKEIRYGVCERWKNSYQDFIADIGPEPKDGPCLCAIDTAKPLGPGNFVWGTKSQAAVCNQRLLTIRGKTMNVSDWSDISGVHLSTIYMRLNRGWAPEDAVFKPRSKSGRKAS